MTDAEGRRWRELAQRAEEGGDIAFRELVRAILPSVRRWALGMTGHPDLADEVAQRVLIRLHRHLPSYDESRPFGPWIYSVTRNAARSLLSAEPSRVPVDEMLPAPSTDPLERIASGRLGDLIRVLFRELSERQREVFDLVDLQGFTPSEVAEMIGLSPATVRVHLHRARVAMRTEILKHHPDLRERYGDEL